MSPCASQNNPEEASGWIVWVHLLVSSSLNIVVMCPTTCCQFACLDCSSCFMVICKCTIIDAKTYVMYCTQVGKRRHKMSRDIEMRYSRHIIPYSGYFWGGGKIFVSSKFLASSWKTFRGHGILNHTPVLCGTVSWVKISWYASQPRKPRKVYPLKNTRYTVLSKYALSHLGFTFRVEDLIQRIMILLIHSS